MPYDVVIIGAGTGGIPCAVEAARHGARVLLVEKDARIGGTLHTSGGHMSAAGTRRQRERGIADSVERHLADIERISGGTARADLVQLAARHAPETIDWLDEHGFDFAPESPRLVYGHEPYGVPRTYYGKDGGLSILAVLKRLLDEQVAAGRVELWLGSTAIALTGAPGVTVLRNGVDEVEVTAPAVVLAGGTCPRSAGCRTPPPRARRTTRSGRCSSRPSGSPGRSTSTARAAASSPRTSGASTARSAPSPPRPTGPSGRSSTTGPGSTPSPW